MDPLKALNLLKECSLHLADVAYYEIVSLLRSLGRLPVAIARVPAGVAIDRVRLNIGETPFTSIDQLSYISDPQVIKDHLVEFGRANKPHQVIFYGAMESSRIGHPRITAIAETSALWQNPNANNARGELYTVSRWRTTREIFVAEMVFATNALETNPDTQRAYQRQVDNLRKAASKDELEFQLMVIQFISDQFARPKMTHHDYKISTGYTEMVTDHLKLDGVTFPSVQTRYWGQNIALHPAAVDNGLQIDVLSMQRLHKVNSVMRLNNVKNCINPGKCAQSLIWEDLEPQYVYTNEQLARDLGVDISSILIP